MNRLDIYDGKEPWNSLHKKEFDRLPLPTQLSIEACQKKIQIEVEKAVIKEFGEKALSKLKPTSGYRSFKGNKKAGGISNSGHLLGVCRDFSRTGIFWDKFVRSNTYIQVIKSRGWPARS